MNDIIYCSFYSLIYEFSSDIKGELGICPNIPPSNSILLLYELYAINVLLDQEKIIVFINPG